MKLFQLSDTTARLILNDEIDLYDILSDREDRIQPGEDVLIQEMYTEIAADHQLNPDDDFEVILEIMYEHIEADHG